MVILQPLHMLDVKSTGGETTSPTIPDKIRADKWKMNYADHMIGELDISNMYDTHTVNTFGVRKYISHI